MKDQLEAQLMKMLNALETMPNGTPGKRECLEAISKMAGILDNPQAA